jgi:hypothetical protein
MSERAEEEALAATENVELAQYAVSQCRGRLARYAEEKGDH